MTTVLLLEDNADMLILLTQVLEWGNYEVIPAYSGKQGLEYLQAAEAPPDVIVSDLLMPEMDGIALIKAVRSNPDWSKIPFIVMSAFDSPEDQLSAIEAGADAFLVKPFALDKFRALLTQWV